MICARNPGIAALGVGVLLAGSAAAAETHPGTLLVLEKGTNTLAVIDSQTLRVIARAPSGTDPHEVIASSDGKRAYITNYGGEGSDLHILSVVDLATRKSLPAIDLGALHSAHGIDAAAGKIYFTAETNKAIGRFDLATRRIDWVMGTGQDRTHMIIVGKDASHLYTANVSSGTISLITETEETRRAGPQGGAGEVRKIWKITNVPAGRGAEGFDVSPDGKQIWAANARDSTVTVIDLASQKAIETFPIPLPGANRLKFTLDGKDVLISGLGSPGPGIPAAPHTNNLIVVDAATHAIVKQLELGGGAAGLLMDPDNRSRAFVGVTQGDKVAVVNLKTFQIDGEIAPLSQPDGLAWAHQN